MRNSRRRTPGGVRAVIYAVLVHVGVVAALVIGFRWTGSDEPEPGQPIQAVIAEDPAKLEAERQRREQEARRKAEEQRRLEQERRQAELERQRLEQEARRQAEEQRRLEEERKRAEAQRLAEEKKRAEEQRRLEEERRKAEAERQRLEEERRKAEAERQRREEEARRRAEAEAALRQQLEEEEQARREAERARLEKQRRGAAVDKMSGFVQLIRQHVSRRWNPPLNVPPGLTCEVQVRFVPGTWEILEATVVRSSGNSAFDASVERAVLASSPLPLPADGDLFKYFGELNFVFDPESS